MTAQKLVVALGQRRRSAFDSRGMSNSSTSYQLLPRCRRTSLQEDTELTAMRKKGDIDQERAPGTCSHRSSVTTAVDEDENRSPNAALIEETRAVERIDVYPEEDFDVLSPRPTEDPLDCGQESSKHSTPKARMPMPGLKPMSRTRRKYGTILREHPHQQLYLFREEAEYSDYVNAMITGVHTEMDSVVFYEVDVRLSQMNWQVLRRFSEFRQLRQRLLKHFSRRQRFQATTSKCKICANILQTIEQSTFPSRKHRKRWYFVLRGRVCSRRYHARSALIIAERKQKLQDFISTCLVTVRSLRQHSRLMCDSSACEISVALRMVEEFLGLSFTRYMRFLNERGILGTSDQTTSRKGTEHSRVPPNEHQQ